MTTKKQLKEQILLLECNIISFKEQVEKLHTLTDELRKTNTELEQELTKYKQKSMKFFDIAVETSRNHMKDIQDHFKRDESDDDEDM